MFSCFIQLNTGLVSYTVYTLHTPSFNVFQQIFSSTNSTFPFRAQQITYLFHKTFPYRFDLNNIQLVCLGKNAHQIVLFDFVLRSSCALHCSYRTNTQSEFLILVCLFSSYTATAPLFLISPIRTDTAASCACIGVVALRLGAFLK